MLRLLSACVLLLAMICGLRGMAQQIPSPIIGAPFTAMRTSIAHGASDAKMTTGIVARRSDGSTYVELKDALGLGTVVITDQVKQRTFELNLNDHTYKSTPIPPELKAMTRPATYVQDYLNRTATIEPGERRANGDLRVLIIGRRIVEGQMTVGYSQTFPDGRIFERWFSPALGQDIQSKLQDPALNMRTDSIVQLIRLEEPDPKLFELPEGFSERFACTTGCSAAQ